MSDISADEGERESAQVVNGAVRGTHASLSLVAETMSAFAKKSFDAVAYAASRPSYPPALYKHVLDYAGTAGSKSPRTLLDLGCGPALSTVPFIPHFDQVIGLDPSAGMIAAAQGVLRDGMKNKTISIDGKELAFTQGSGEALPEFIDNECVDLAVAGQAAHWFDAPRVYSELDRVLKPGGAFVFWGYGEFFLPGHASINRLIPKYSGGKLGPYWQQPGRSITEALLVPFPFPDPSTTSFDSSSFKRLFFLRDRAAQPAKNASDPESAKIEISSDGLLLTHHWSLSEIEAYLNTFSSALSYKEHHNGEDPVPEMVESLRQEGLNERDKVQVAWEVGMIMGKKRARRDAGQVELA